MQELLDRFVKVRIVHMADVDLAQFQFDYDLTWSAFLMNADGTIYGRFGTRSIAGPMAHISVQALKNAMTRALDLHADYPGNRAQFVDKRGAEPRWKRALDIPALSRRMGDRPAEQNQRKGCIHCHHIYDGWNDTAYDEDAFYQDTMWKYPLPESVGMTIDVDSGNVVESVAEGSFAERADIHAGDVVRSMNGQPIISQADMQWVLHHTAPESEVEVVVGRDGAPVTSTLAVSGEWKRSNIIWRASFPSIRPHLWVRAPELSVEEKSELGLGVDDLALKVTTIWAGAARRAGLMIDDIIVDAGGRTTRMDNGEFHIWLKLVYKDGDSLPTIVLRDGERIPLLIPIM
ncbi:PDZ domain-containing protein [Candidatus Poribacteria bacterium]|jgi:serine protease Do|nr:PDZ domain-containing protein [Candidatus Poribacteria bacterium]MBT5536809.1 PDZ domain-containing protein [Candidatus Poribacteria bacterium]MBT5710492.1 PDZ domain-containing protein [Candidatus Poribacteria bacterium]MBT7098916.1 PDZ domain-containing protein [Candidatus Poribacteria bacterium]MBT7805327.1 PDZ domain-containing protein [Candidatus Poribacteria bacterium]